MAAMPESKLELKLTNFRGHPVSTYNAHSSPAYPSEFRCQMVDPVRSGRTPKELSRDFEPNAITIADGICRAHAEGDTRRDVVTAAEGDGLGRLCY